MTPPQTTAAADARQDPFRHGRADRACAFAAFSDPFDSPSSQRDYAQRHGIPRSTLGHWMRQQAPDGLDPELVSFLRRPAGEAFLRRITLAALLVFHHGNACGLRPVGRFFELAQLDRFVASSYGALHAMAARLAADLAAFGDDEGRRLAALMKPRDIALVPDENFHGPHCCLVAVEPVSHFILVEAYRERRDAATWAEAVEQATADLPVRVVALSSDQAKGLIACAGQLGAQYTPELFHGQRDLVRPLLGALRRRIGPFEKDWQRAREQTEHWLLEKEKAQRAGQEARAAQCDWRAVQAADEERLARRVLDEEQRQRQRAKEALRGLADDYHPFDPTTGQPLTPEAVQERLLGHVEALEEVACVAGSSAAIEEALGKGKGWITALVASLAWFWAVAQRRIEERALPEEAERAAREKLLAGLYWGQAARRGRTAEDRRERKALAERLLKEAWEPGGPLNRLGAEEKEALPRLGREVVGLFSRSSSCVEGRNGRLSLLRHGHTRLSAERLKALTVMHNYVARRDDGSTAAERFFGVEQRDAFSWLLQRMPDLPRPAAGRSKKSRPTACAAG